MKLLTKEEFFKKLRGPKGKYFPPAERERRYKQHVLTHQFLQSKGSKQPARAARTIKIVKKVQTRPVVVQTVQKPMHPNHGRSGPKRKSNKRIDSNPGSARPSQILTRMFPRVTFPRFEDVNAGGFHIRPGKTLNGRSTYIVFFSFKVATIQTDNSGLANGSVDIIPSMFNLNGNSKFTAFAAIWQQVRLLGLKFYLQGIQGRDTPGKIVCYIDYKSNGAPSVPTLASLEQRDTKVEILASDRLGSVTWGRDDLEDARFIDAVSSNYWRPPDASGTNSHDVFYYQTDACPATTRCWDLYVHAFTEWNESII